MFLHGYAEYFGTDSELITALIHAGYLVFGHDHGKRLQCPSITVLRYAHHSLTSFVPHVKVLHKTHVKPIYAPS